MLFYTTCRRPLHSRTVFKKTKVFCTLSRLPSTLVNILILKINHSLPHKHLEILKTNHRFTTIMHHEWVWSSLKLFSRHSALYLKIKKNTRVIKMDKKPTIALSVLDAVRGRFPETQEFIDSTLKEESEK